MYSFNICKPDSRKYDVVSNVYRVTFLYPDSSHFETSFKICSSLREVENFFASRIKIKLDIGYPPVACFLQVVCNGRSDPFAKWVTISHYFPNETAL